LRKKNILVCPLDWGLGHATRCVPLIAQFIKEGHQVIIGADKNPLAFLKQEFPALKTVVIPGYEVSYSEKGNSLKLFYESIQFFNFIKKEHGFIDEIIEEYNIDMIVSDNRYGLWSKKVKSIIITHQLYVKAVLGEKIAHKKIEKLISNFDECWIPDAEGQPNLSGDLSHLKAFNYPHKFIGPLSRFTSLQLLKSCINGPLEMQRNEQTFEYDIIAILSGPEPQRTIFEKMVLEQIKRYNLKAIVVRGLPSSNVITRDEATLSSGDEIASSVALPRYAENIKMFNHLPTAELFNFIAKSKVVVCRAGYSSIMDLAALDKKAILVPTPGQTEQEYLANYHHKKGGFYSQMQSEFDLKIGLDKIESFTPEYSFTNDVQLDSLLKKR
jgi:UDP:flavonoid glycosyltransferase YjiC (YdhE family)